MKNKKMMKNMAVTMMLVAALGCTGCSNGKKDDTGSDSQGSLKESTQEVTKTESEGGDVNSEGVKQDENIESHGTVKSLSEIEELAEECVYEVNWYTTEGAFYAGTSFILDRSSTEQNEELLVTAFHYLCPDDKDSIQGSELPEYVLGGQIREAKSGNSTIATLKNCLIIDDAKAVPDANKDVAAFSVHDSDVLDELPVSTHEVKEGDTVYLLANLWDTDDKHENCVYEGTVIGEDDGALYYDLDETYGTAGASGAPIVNEYGEVVGIHLASNGSTRIAHSVQSFIDQINHGTFAETEYPSDLSGLSTNEEGITESEYNTYNLTRDDIMNTHFYTIRPDSIAFTDSLGTNTAPDGYQYMVIDIAVDAYEKMSGAIALYNQDFYVQCDKPQDPDDDEREELQAIEDTMVDGQLEDDIDFSAGVSASGKLVFMIPDTAKTVDFTYGEFVGLDNDLELNNLYISTFPVEDWQR